jgi:hypothetical protein
MKVLEGFKSDHSGCAVNIANGLDSAASGERLIDSILTQKIPHATYLEDAAILQPAELANKALASEPRLGTLGGQVAQFKEPRHPVESLVRSDFQALCGNRRDDSDRALVHASKLRAHCIVVIIEIAAIKLVHLGDEGRFKGQIAFGSVLLRIDHHDEFLAERPHVIVIEGPIRQCEGRLGLPVALCIGRHHVAMPDGKLRPIGLDVHAVPEELASAIA